jgi:hypothetical protein
MTENKFNQFNPAHGQASLVVAAPKTQHPVACDQCLYPPPKDAIEKMKNALRSRLKFPLRFNLFQAFSKQLKAIQTKKIHLVAAFRQNAALVRFAWLTELTRHSQFSAMLRTVYHPAGRDDFHVLPRRPRPGLTRPEALPIGAASHQIAPNRSDFERLLIPTSHSIACCSLPF